MLLSFLAIIFGAAFAYLTWRHFEWGIFALFFLLPTYLIRFNFGPLPTTILELMISVITIIWLIKYHRTIIGSLKSAIKTNYSYTLFIAAGLFLIAATIAIFTSSDLRAALGEWKAFYFEPILFFIILITTKKDWRSQNIILALILSGLLTSLLAIYQHFTGYLVPEAFWQNHNTFRVTAWYGFPNGVGLFLAPLIPLAIYLAKQKNNFLKYLAIIFVPLAFLAIIFSKGTGPLLGAVCGLGLLLLIYKKTRWWTFTTAIITVFILLTLPKLSNLRQEISFGDRSGQIRLAIWGETLEFLKAHPIAGAGLADYQEKIVPYHTTVNGEGIEIFHHPHNIFLTMYVNLGLLGLFAFVWIIVSCLRISLIQIKNKKITMIQLNNNTIYIIASLLTILVMGLVDSPYIKNDLAILFWLLPALLLTNQYELEK